MLFRAWSEMEAKDGASKTKDPQDIGKFNWLHLLLSWLWLCCLSPWTRLFNISVLCIHARAASPGVHFFGFMKCSSWFSLAFLRRNLLFFHCVWVSGIITFFHCKSRLRHFNMRPRIQTLHPCSSQQHTCEVIGLKCPVCWIKWHLAVKLWIARPWLWWAELLTEVWRAVGLSLDVDLEFKKSFW